LVAERQRARNRLGEDEAGDEAGSRGRHREPEGRAQDEQATGLLLRVEVEAEEGARDAAAKDRHEDGRERHEHADGAEVRRLKVGRIERQQHDRDHARDDPAEAVNRRVAREPLQLPAEHQSRA
jgi:hypothetical protein